MRIKRMLAMAVAVVLLAGCSNANAVNITYAPSATPTSVTTPAPTPTPTLAPTPTPMPTIEPTPAPDPYFTQDEQVKSDEGKGYWLYTSPTLYVEINRVFDKENMVTYYAAEIRLKKGETEHGGFSTPKKPGGKSTNLYKIAQYYKAVVAVNGDFLDHNTEDPKGVIIRDGKVFMNDDAEDSLAFYPDGTMRVFEMGEVTADRLLADGVKNAFSFGPTLIKDGVIQAGLDKHRLRKKNPRTAVGMIEPYHYLLVVADGRQSGYSSGITLTELAEVFASYNCKVAYNFDGGQSATMAFMGKNITSYGGSTTGQRPVPDALMFGTSELVK